MKATKIERGNIRNRVVDNSALTILGLQIVLGCVYLNSYLDIVAILPSAIYFSPIKNYDINIPFIYKFSFFDNAHRL